MNLMLEVKGLSKSFGEKKVVDGLSFNLEKGIILGFLGPNGAGKSTTIKMITTILEKEEGEILFNGKSIKKDEINFKKSLGLVPQDIALYDDLNAYDNIRFFGSLYGLKGEDLKRRTRESLELVGLYDRKNDYPSEFSGGMKRRLNIACSIVHNPKILIMDEPTVGIDPQSRNKILEVTKNLRYKGTAIIYVSHYMEEVESICQEIVIADEGKIIERGQKDALKDKYKKEGLNNIEEIFLHLTGKELRD